MVEQGWKRLLPRRDAFRGPGKYAIAAYSEFMPPPRFGVRPYGEEVPPVFDPADPFGWVVTEYEEQVEIRPGLAHLAETLVQAMAHLGQGLPSHGIAQAKLQNNPYWPDELAGSAGRLAHEHYVVLAPLALSRTQDDKGRVRWTLFGGSEQGPETAFWKGFFTGPDGEIPPAEAEAFFRELLHEAYGEPPAALADLRSCGLRVLPTEEPPGFPYWRPAKLPRWVDRYRLGRREPLDGVRYLLSFGAFGSLPPRVRQAYLAGRLHLLPFPGSLVFWGAPLAAALQRELPLAMQVPLLNLFARYEAVRGLRVLQSGWLHEPHPALAEPHPHHGPLRDTYRRTHRGQRIHRGDDVLAVTGTEDRLAHVLFSAAADDLGLYGKPMARNAHIWTLDGRLLLDGPRADRAALARAAAALRQGGQFGYRFYFPPMQVGRWCVFWQRPLAAFRHPRTGACALVASAPTGYLTAYRADRPDPASPVELWPRILRRAAHLAAVEGFSEHREHQAHKLAINTLKLLGSAPLAPCRPLPRQFARSLLTLPREESLEDWLRAVSTFGGSGPSGPALRRELESLLEPAETGDGLRRAEDGGAKEAERQDPPPLPTAHRPLPTNVDTPLTFAQSARRRFEVAYWNSIARLSAGQFVNKETADCARDAVSQRHRRGHGRDLPAMGEYLLAYYGQVLAAAGVRGALAGEQPFRWHTDFDFPWLGGWAENRQGESTERNLLVRIPGRDRRQAVVMADHYDTAYMEDVYHPPGGARGPRWAAAGADDNCSATAALMLAAPILLGLSRAGRLGCDVWLVHLTGEEFPSDCLGARHLAQAIVEGTLAISVPGRRPVDLSRVSVRGVYVLDMVAHNHDHDRDVFQIAPGVGRRSMALAYEAHRATMLWNQCAGRWNRARRRRGRPRAARSEDPRRVPEIAPHPVLDGQVRPAANPRSTLFNTDGQIFSDAGIPVVLFMENYDINRQGYHDTHDTMANIDLDYGSAVAAIAIESVARAAAADET
jgi:hypothetical protein